MPRTKNSGWSREHGADARLGGGETKMKKSSILLFGFLQVLFAQRLASNHAYPIHDEDVACAKSATLSELTKEPGIAILNAYGYNLREPWACTKLDAPFFRGATLLHFRKVSAQSDENTAFSVVQTAGSTYLWIIPTASGMLEERNVESDPHNIAAFNSLLRSLRKSPTNSVEWWAIGKAYMALVGQTAAVAIESLPGDSGSCNVDHECTLAFADRPTHLKETYVRWTLTFDTAHDNMPPRLIDARSEVVPVVESRSVPIRQGVGPRVVGDEMDRGADGNWAAMEASWRGR